MARILDVDEPENVVFSTPTGSAPPGISQAITQDPALPDGPYRTLHYYQGCAARKRPSTLAGAARARGVSTRTILAHRKTLIEAGYLSVNRPNDGPATLTLKDPARLDRLKEIAARLAGEESAPTAIDEQACLGKLRQVCPRFNAAGAGKLARTYAAPTPLMELLEQWVAGRGNIPPAWGAGMIYREIEAGNPPPAPAEPARTLRDDPEWSAAFEAQEEKTRQRIDEEYLALIGQAVGTVAEIRAEDLPGLLLRFEEPWEATWFREWLLGRVDLHAPVREILEETPQTSYGKKLHNDDDDV